MQLVECLGNTGLHPVLCCAGLGWAVLCCAGRLMVLLLGEILPIHIKITCTERYVDRPHNVSIAKGGLIYFWGSLAGSRG